MTIAKAFAFLDPIHSRTLFSDPTGQVKKEVVTARLFGNG